jgi:hypothetical protein
MSNRSAWQLASETVAEAYERYIMAAFGNAWAQALVQLAAPEDGVRQRSLRRVGGFAPAPAPAANRRAELIQDREGAPTT